MSRDDYSGVRSPGRSRRLTELPTVDRSPSRDHYGQRASPLGKFRKSSSVNNFRKYENPFRKK